MSQSTRIQGKNGTGPLREVQVHNFKTSGDEHSALVTLAHPFLQFEPNIEFFVNDTLGAAMNQNVTFGTIPSIIHDGGTTSSADTGTADTNTLNKLVQTGQNFNTTVVAGMVVHNTTDDTYATITAVDSDTSLSLDSDAFPDGNEDYVINAVWTGTAVQGTWNFADSGKISLTSGNNADEASIDADTAASWDMDNFTALTGKVDLDSYTPLVNDFEVSFTLNGVLVGNSVNLNDYIDTGDFAEQSFAIPKADLGLSGQTVNGLTLFLVRTGGAKPTVKFDDLQLEASGTPAVFTVPVNVGDRFHIDELAFTYRDNIDSISTVTGATENVTNTALDFNAILGVSALANGFIIQRTRKGKTTFSATIRTIGAHVSAGAIVSEIHTAPDGSSTSVVLKAVFKEPLIIDGDEDDSLTVTINDNMSGLTQFTAAARGGLEVL